MSVTFDWLTFLIDQNTIYYWIRLSFIIYLKIIHKLKICIFAMKQTKWPSKWNRISKELFSPDALASPSSKSGAVISNVLNFSVHQVFKIKWNCLRVWKDQLGIYLDHWNKVFSWVWNWKFFTELCHRRAMVTNVSCHPDTQ